MCEAQRPLGRACTRDRQCMSDQCTLVPSNRAFELPILTCVAANACTMKDEYQNCEKNEFCNTKSATNVCAARKGLGSLCTRDRQCLSGKCHIGVCRQYDCTNDGDCANVEWCKKPDLLKPKSNYCAPKRRVGAECSRPDQCTSGFCESGVCYTGEPQ